MIADTSDSSHEFNQIWSTQYLIENSAENSNEDEDAIFTRKKEQYIPNRTSLQRFYRSIEHIRIYEGHLYVLWPFETIQVLYYQRHASLASNHIT